MSPAEHLARLAAAVLLCLPLCAEALDSDRDQPVHLESDQASIDDQQGVNIFTGNVHLRQGTMNLRGDRMTVYLVEGSIDRAELDGSPATFVQRPEGEDSDMHASALRMEYHATDERIILLGKARVWNDEGREFRSERIVYHLESSSVDAGGSAAPATSGEPGGRVHIILPPKRPPAASAEEAAP
jgi:lipopolysaccharide export system protein LptA